MHIKEIEIVNFKNIKEFKASTTLGVYLITGENEKGKTSLLDAMLACLTGKRGDFILTKGETKGHAKFTVQNADKSYTVELRYTEKNPRGTLTITDNNSELSTDRLSYLQKLFKYTDFDAGEFINLSKTTEGRRKQVEIIRRFLPNSILAEIDNIEAQLAGLRDKRKELNAEVNMHQNVIKSYDIDPDEAKKYSEGIDIIKLTTKKENAININNDYHKIEEQYNTWKDCLRDFNSKTSQRVNEYKDEMHLIDIEIEELEKKINKYKEMNEELDNKKNAYIEEREEDFKKLQDEASKAADYLQENKKIDILEIENEISKALEFNKKVQEYNSIRQSNKQLQEAKEKHSKIEEKIASQSNKKDKLIKEHKLPVEGLSFDEDGLILNGIPFRPDSISTSQEMEIALKLTIAANENVKIFRIAQGESLGDKKFNEIIELAKKEGYQGFIEQVVRGQDELKMEQYTESK